jgi:hypothetical protein
MMTRRLWATWRDRAALGRHAVAEQVSEQDKQDADRYFSFEFEVWQYDLMCAGASGTREQALAEAMRYAAQYQEDGPVRVFEVIRKLVADIPKDRAAIAKESI